MKTADFYGLGLIWLRFDDWVRACRTGGSIEVCNHIGRESMAFVSIHTR